MCMNVILWELLHMSSHVTPCIVISHHTYHVISHYITPCYVLSHHITSHYITPCHVISHHITLYHTMPYNITSYHIIVSGMCCYTYPSRHFNMTFIFLVNEPCWGCGLVGRAFASICEAVGLISVLYNPGMEAHACNHIAVNGVGGSGVFFFLIFLFFLFSFFFFFFCFL